MRCSLYSNRKPTVGCVATATAQIMAFHQSPSNLSWGLMPNDYGSSYTAQLMADIGAHVNMDYSCDGSSATTANAAGVLRETSNSVRRQKG